MIDRVDTSHAPEAAVKLHLLQYLVAIANRGSMRGAALELGVSAAAVSRALIELENLAGVSLLERKAKGVEMTTAGAALLTQARQVLSQLEAADRTLASLRGSAQGSRLAIGVTPWIAATLLGTSLHLLTRRRPNLSLNIHEVMGTDYRLLRDGTIDLAIGIAPDQSGNEFNVLPLFRYATAIICRIGHPLSRTRHVAELAGQDWLLTREVEQYVPVTHPLVASVRASRVHYARSTLAAITMIRSTDMLAICPWPLVESDFLRNSVEALNLHDGDLPEFETAVVTRHNVAVSGAMRDFVTCLTTAIEQSMQSPDPKLRRLFNTLSLPSDP